MQGKGKGDLCLCVSCDQQKHGQVGLACLLCSSFNSLSTWKWKKGIQKERKNPRKKQSSNNKKKERKGKPSEEKQQKEANHRHQSNDRAGANDVENRECCRQHSGIAATSTAVRHQTAVTRRSQSPNQPLKRQVTTTASVCCRVLLFLLLSPHTHTRTCMNTRAL